MVTYEQGKYKLELQLKQEYNILHENWGSTWANVCLVNALKEVVLIFLYVQNYNEKMQNRNSYVVITAYYIVLLKHTILNFMERIFNIL